MIKSKKNWIVVSSLTLSGLLIWGSPSLDVKADTVATNQVQENTNSDNSSSTDTADSSTDNNTNQINGTTNLGTNDPTANLSHDTTSESSDSNQVTNSQTNRSNGTTNLGSNDPTAESNSNSDQTVSSKSSITPSSASSTQDSSIPSNALASGNYGDAGATDSQWYISEDKTLHLGAGTISSKSRTTSPWANYSDNITTVSFDGTTVFPRNSSYMFADLTNVTSFNNWSHTDFSDVGSFVGMFKNDTSLESVTFPVWPGDITRRFSDFSHMFENDTSLKFTSISGWDINNVISMESMFANDTSLESVGLDLFEQRPFATIASLANVKNMFLNDKSLKTIDMHNWGMYNHDMSTSNMFAGTNLQSITLSTLNKFTSNTVLPATNTTRWLNIGDGTKQDPQGNKTFSTSSISDFYDGSNLIRYPYSNDEKDKYFVDTFIPDPRKTGDVTIPSNLGPQTVSNVSGNIGDTVDVTVPVIGGYTADKTKVTATVNEDGTITTKDSVVYSPISKEITADVTIKSNLGDKVVPDVSGKVGDTFAVKVPDVKGYTQNPKTVNVTVNANGTITTKDSVTYVPISSNTSSHHSSSNTHQYNVDLNKQNNTVATFSDQADVSLYSWDSNHTMSDITSRGLKHGTDWFSDEKLTIDGLSYYRVATNEWVKASQVYVYQAHSTDIQTNSDSNKVLRKAEGNIVTNRGLAPNSSWYSDRTANINDEKYYRVATNEFVNKNDIREY